MEEINALIEKELGLENVDKEIKDQVITELGEVVMERVLTIILAKDEDGQMEKIIKKRSSRSHSHKNKTT